MRESLQTLLKLERELQVARRIQQHTFPQRLPQLDGYDLAAWSDPAEETGGDTYDVIGVQEESGVVRLSDERAPRAVLLLADATGHGVGPALSVTQVRAMLRMAVRRRGDLASIARDMNDQLCADLDGGRFVTAWLGQVDAQAGLLTGFSAGQGPLLHYDAARDAFETFLPNAPPLGILRDIEFRASEPLRLGRGDLFAVFSDGIYEASDAAGNHFGEPRVREFLRTHCKSSAAEILESLWAAVHAFTRGAPPNDDRTAVLIKRD